MPRALLASLGRIYGSCYGWCYDHSPLVAAITVAVLWTVVSIFWASNAWWLSFAPGMAGGAWEIVMLLVIFDLTPKRAKEKKETGGVQ